MQTGTVRRSVRGHLHNVAPAAIVQMIAIERETCALEVRADERQGTLFFVAGELHDAEHDELRGEEAAIQILGWDRCDVEMRATAGTLRQTINAPLTFVLLEAMRRRDERPEEADGGALPLPLPGTPDLQALLCDLDGLAGAVLVETATGRMLAECSSTLDHDALRRACLEVVAVEQRVLAALGLSSALEEIVLTFDGLMVVLRLLWPGVLAGLVADPARCGLPALRAALGGLAESGASTWRG